MKPKMTVYQMGGKMPIVPDANRSGEEEAVCS
jgi:hypothetical protein